MKKLLLLFAAGSIAMGAGAQERSSSAIFTSKSVNNNSAAVHSGINKQAADQFPVTGARTTAGPGGSRWYNYGDSVLGTNSTIPGVIHFGGFALWGDTTGRLGYTSGTTVTYGTTNFVSVGLSFDPYCYTCWNDSTHSVGQIKISTSDAYTIDSVGIFGGYHRSSISSKTGVVDTLRLAFVYGNGGGTSNLPTYYFTGMTSHYGTDTLNYLQMMYDSTKNHADTNGTAAPLPYIKDLYLTSADSSSNFATAVPVNFAVPAANYAAMSMSFKTGDPAWTYGSLDTIRRADGSYKYHDFTVDYYAAGASSTSLSFPPYNKKDHTSGYWKRHTATDGASGRRMYTPNWSWTTSSGASPSGLQYPFIWYHVKCTTCDIIHNTASVNDINKGIASVNAYPNPANNELTVSFSLTNRSDVSVVLSNLMGQTISTQTAQNILNGNAVINTATVPAGVYFCTITANGEHTTTRVVIAH